MPRSRREANRRLVRLVEGGAAGGRGPIGGAGLCYQLRLRLLGTREPVWRVVRLRGEISLRSLNRLIRHLLGWPEDNQYCLWVRWWRDDEGQGVVERRARLCDVVSLGDRLTYGYEYRDGWRVEVLVEEVLPAGG